MDSSAQNEYSHRPKNTMCILKPIDVEIGGDSSSVITPLVAQQTGSRHAIALGSNNIVRAQGVHGGHAFKFTTTYCCKICRKEFASKKARGGHMRMHPKRHRWSGLIPPTTGESSANSSQTRGLEFILIVPQEKPNASAIFELNLLAPEAQEKALAFPKFDLNVPAPEENDDDNAY